MAPNLITLIGLLFVMTSAGIGLCFTAPTLSHESLPSWAFYFFGSSVWIYASLDAIDGKQARRTGETGPLGELFDHGCDAVNLALMNLIIPLIFGLEIDVFFFLAVFILLFGFYVVTWDEYHTHTLYLTTLSGPVEGTLVFTICSFVSGYFGGSHVWKRSLKELIPFAPANVQLRHMALLGIIVPGIGAIITSLLRVYHKRPKAYKQLLPFIFCSVFAAFTFVLEPICKAYVAEFIMVIGLAFINAITSIIVAHLTLSEFAMFEPAYFPICLGGTLALLKHFGHMAYDQQQALTFMHGAFVYLLVIYMLRARLTVSQMASYLDIYCLSIKNMKKRD